MDTNTLLTKWKFIEIEKPLNNIDVTNENVSNNMKENDDNQMMAKRMNPSPCQVHDRSLLSPDNIDINNDDNIIMIDNIIDSEVSSNINAMKIPIPMQSNNMTTTQTPITVGSNGKGPKKKETPHKSHSILSFFNKKPIEN